MIVEQRDYHVFTGKLPELLKAYETEGIAIQQEHLGGFIGAFTTDVGALSTYTHLWRYESYADRDGANLSWINVEPMLDPLHGDPRFEALVQKVIAPKSEPKP